MTRSREERAEAERLHRAGLSALQIHHLTGIPTQTINDWRRTDFAAPKQKRFNCESGGLCDFVRDLDELPYSYLLGLYLGDGCLALQRRGVYRLRIVLDTRYPDIIDECREAMGEVIHTSRVSQVAKTGCQEISATSKHWPCLFPQHGPGPKHKRPIVLADWQRWVAIEREPQALLRGLIHSDGSRFINHVKRKYAYPRYMFSNRSQDIQQIFKEACARAGIDCRQSYKWTVSVSTAEAVAKMDEFIGPKS